MRLCLDFGNTRVKAAVFQVDQLIKHSAFAAESHLYLSSLLRSMELCPSQITELVYASVHPTWNADTFFDIALPKFHIADDTQIHTKLNIKYHPVSTMGADRLALLCAGFFLLRSKNFLIIDVGTCITYDLVRHAEYIGGRISPGFLSRLASMQSSAPLLPKVKLSEGQTPLPFSNTTQSCMQSGVFWGGVSEIKEAISFAKKKHPETQVVIAGGNAGGLLPLLDSNVWFRPNFVLEGLNVYRSKTK